MKREHRQHATLIGPLLLLYSVLASITLVHAQNAPSPYHWSNQHSQYSQSFFAHLPLQNSYVVTGSQNLHLGRLTALLPQLTPQEHALIEDRAAIASLWDGSLFVGGSSRTLARSSFMRIDAASGDIHILPAEVAAVLPGGGFNTSEFVVHSPNIVQFGAAFSYDAGYSWFVPDGAQDPAKDFYLGLTWFEDDTVFVYSMSENAMYAIDSEARKIVKAPHRSPDRCQTSRLSDGSLLAVRLVAEAEVDVIQLRPGSSTWTSVPPLRTPTGDSIHLRRFIFMNRNQLIAYEGKVFFFLDSSLVVTFYGDSTVVRCITSDCRRGRISSFRRLGDTLVQYIDQYVRQGQATERRFITFNLRTEVATEHRIPAHVIPAQVTRISNAHVYQASGGLLIEYDDEPGVIRYAMRMLNADHEVVQNVGIRTVRARGNRIMGIDAGNTIVLASQRDFDRERLPIVTRAFASHTVFTRTTPEWYSDSSIVHTHGGHLLRTTLSGRRDTLRSDSTSAFTLAANGDMYAGMRSLFVRSSEGDWRDVPIPSGLVHHAALMSDIHVGTSGILLTSFRGHSVGSSWTETVDSTLRGGILRSTDNGATWQPVDLPCDCQWVESMTSIPNAGLYAWASNVMRDEAHRGAAAVSSVYLLRSTNEGASWTIVHSDEREPFSRDEVGVMQWPIAVSPSGIIAAATQRRIVLSFDGGESFVFFERTPIEGVNGLDFASDGTLWASSWKGLYALQVPTSAVQELVATRENPFEAHYHSSTNSILVRRSFESSPEQYRLHLIASDGRVVQRAELTGAAVQVSAAGLSNGLYFITARSPNGTQWSFPVLVMP